jgi:hypothetical protein
MDFVRKKTTENYISQAATTVFLFFQALPGRGKWFFYFFRHCPDGASDFFIFSGIARTGQAVFLFFQALPGRGKRFFYFFKHCPDGASGFLFFQALPEWGKPLIIFQYLLQATKMKLHNCLNNC